MVRFVVLSVLALCLVMPGAFSQKCRKGGLCEQATDKTDDDHYVWLFHFGPGVDSRQEYLNPLTGEVNGYHVDIMNAVCEIADKNCQIVYDLQQNCWDSVDGTAVGGFGVFNFYYDACVGWYPTVPRLRTFQFTDSYSQGVAAGFSVAAGNSDGFDAADLTDKKIGFVRGFFTDTSCVARQGDAITGASLSDDQIVLYSDLADLKEGVLTGEVDAGFAEDTEFETDDAFDFLNNENPISCAEGGPAVMMRKDNPMKSWFDPALQELLGSEQYQEICDGLAGVHGDKPGPDGGDLCLRE